LVREEALPQVVVVEEVARMEIARRFVPRVRAR
jgi:hypothetical protein